MTTDRLEIRLDPAQRKGLASLAAAKRQSVSEVVRALVDAELNRVDRDERRRAAEAIAKTRLPGLPSDVGELTRELEEIADSTGSERARRDPRSSPARSTKRDASGRP
jgi:hypothetical protein